MGGGGVNEFFIISYISFMKNNGYIRFFSQLPAKNRLLEEYPYNINYNTEKQILQEKSPFFLGKSIFA